MKLKWEPGTITGRQVLLAVFIIFLVVESNIDQDILHIAVLSLQAIVDSGRDVIPGS